MIDLDRVRTQLPGRRIEWHVSISSTMIRAAELLDQGCASGTIVGAEEQTAGIGRHGRSWISPPGRGLYVSFVLRLPLKPEQLPLAMLSLGLATRDAIAGVTERTPDLRWPNDVLIGEKKCAGVLAQLERDAIIAGIGINVSQTSFPQDLDTPATSLALEGTQAAREDLLVALASAIDHECRSLSTTSPVERFARASSYASGRRVRARAEGRGIEGVTRGLDASGFLRIREDNGRETTILAGGVRPL